MMQYTNFKIIRPLITKYSVYVFLYMVMGAILFSLFTLTPEENSDLLYFRLFIIFFASVLLSKYFIYMILSPWHDVLIALRHHRLKMRRKEPYEPRVSVLIPAWNEEVGITTTVQALLQSTYTNMEIIVIDNASTDNSAQSIQGIIRRYYATVSMDEPHIDVVYSYESEQGKGHALNNGLRRATGDIIMSIDADCYVPPESMSNFVKYFEDPKVMAAVGNVKIGSTRSLLGVIQYLEFLFSFYFKKGDSLMNTIYIIGGAAGAFRREVFEKLGDYSATNITEDIELSVRIQDAGMKIVYASDAIVYTEGASDLPGLMKQRLRWKRGRFETFMEHKHLFFSTKKEHNKILTWGILPLALFGEAQLSLEIIFLIFLYAYAYMTNDFSSFLSGVIVVSSMFVIQVLFDDHAEGNTHFLFLAPIGWLLFYVSTFVESNALVRALWGYLRGEPVVWQKWKRTGVFTE